jgi:Transposase IS4
MYLYIGTVGLEKHLQLSPTHAAVFQLMKTLPYYAYQFTLFCDNLFGNPKLFSLLQSLGIGACGTARRQVTKPIFGNIDDWKAPWGTLRSIIVDAFPDKELQGSIPDNRNVLVSVWQDSNKVGYCTTVHDGTEWPVKNRKRPKITSTSAAITKQPFYMFYPPLKCKEPYEHTRLLPIPGAIDDYNHYMGGVDIADQLRSGFSTQQCGLKPWRPLFYWLLDTTIINAYYLSEHQRKARIHLNTKDKVRSAHRTFREALVSELLKDPSPKASKRPYVTHNTVLPKIRLTRPMEIHQQILGKRAPCVFCRWSRVTKRGRTMKVIKKSQNVNKTITVCSHCGINLCIECFTVFHYYID